MRVQTMRQRYVTEVQNDTIVTTLRDIVALQRYYVVLTDLTIDDGCDIEAHECVTLTIARDVQRVLLRTYEHDRNYALSIVKADPRDMI